MTDKEKAFLMFMHNPPVNWLTYATKQQMIDVFNIMWDLIPTCYTKETLNENKPLS